MIRIFLALALIALGWSYPAHAQQVFDPKQNAIACAYNISPPTLTTGWYGLIQCDSSGRILLGGPGSSASNPLPVAGAFPATNTPVTGTFSAPGVSATFTPASSAAFNIFLGTGAGAVHLEKRIASTGTWSVIEAAGTQLYNWTTFTTAFVEQATEEQSGVEYRLNCTAVSTPIAYTIK